MKTVCYAHGASSPVRLTGCSAIRPSASVNQACGDTPRNGLGRAGRYDYTRVGVTRASDGTTVCCDMVRGSNPGVTPENARAFEQATLTLGNAWVGRLTAAIGAPLQSLRGIGRRFGAAERVMPEIGFTRAQLQHAFKHAGDFGVAGNPNNRTLAEFSLAIQNHIAAPGTHVIQGSYRGKAVTHFVDPTTGLNVMRDRSGTFISGRKLSPSQLDHLTSTGKLGGGR